MSVILFSAAVNLNGEVGGENEQRFIKESRREKTPPTAFMDDQWVP